MQINYELANYVIGEASKLTSLPLLFTDKSGEVLCGRKPSDVGLVIPAVKETVQSGTQVPLNPKEPPFAKGAVFPVMLRDQIIGAAAVLGSPSAYEPCLAMLSFTLNTLVEKTTEVERASQKRNLTETWIANLFNEDYTDWLELDNTARMLGIRVDVPSTVIVFSVTRKAHGIGSSLYLEPTFVEKQRKHSGPDSAGYGNG